MPNDHMLLCFTPFVILCSTLGFVLLLLLLHHRSRQVTDLPFVLTLADSTHATKMCSINKRQEVWEENRVQVSRTTGTEKWMYKESWLIQPSLGCSSRDTVLGPTSGARIRKGPNEMVPDQHVLLRSRDLILLPMESHQKKRNLRKDEWVWNFLPFLDQQLRSLNRADSGEGTVHEARDLGSDCLVIKAWPLCLLAI